MRIVVPGAAICSGFIFGCGNTTKTTTTSAATTTTTTTTTAPEYEKLVCSPPPSGPSPPDSNGCVNASMMSQHPGNSSQFFWQKGSGLFDNLPDARFGQIQFLQPDSGSCNGYLLVHENWFDDLGFESDIQNLSAINVTFGESLSFAFGKQSRGIFNPSGQNITSNSTCSNTNVGGVVQGSTTWSPPSDTCLCSMNGGGNHVFDAAPQFIRGFLNWNGDLTQNDLSDWFFAYIDNGWCCTDTGKEAGLYVAFQIAGEQTLLCPSNVVSTPIVSY